MESGKGKTPAATRHGLQWKMKLAIDSGELVRPDACSECGATGTKIYGHHDDYSKPLAVRWLCGACHRKFHACHTLRGSQFIASDVKIAPMLTPLKTIRMARGLKQMDVAAAIGTHPANLLRIEAGTQTPKPDVAHALFDFYGGEVSLGAIYDGRFSTDRELDNFSGSARVLARAGILDSKDGNRDAGSTGGNSVQDSAGDAHPAHD
jgi:transcriptional regulator with XRE-family HTH domain/ribosomal protein S27AE